MTAERYPIRLYGDPVLRRRAAPIRNITATFTVPGYNGVDLPRLARNMLETMYEAHGVGLAAPQIGLPLRMFVAAEYSEDKKEGAKSLLKSRVMREFVMVNPTFEILVSRDNLTRFARFVLGSVAKSQHTTWLGSCSTSFRHPSTRGC